MKVHDLKPAAGSRRAPKRIARGIGGKGGKTAGRGTKGQGARDTIKPGFEGGQTPLHRRTPKAKGFKNPFRVEYHVVNLDTLELFDAGSEVSPATLRAAWTGRQAGTGQGPRPRGSLERPDGQGARVLGLGQAGHRGRGRIDRDRSGALG